MTVRGAFLMAATVVSGFAFGMALAVAVAACLETFFCIPTGILISGGHCPVLGVNLAGSVSTAIVFIAGAPLLPVAAIFGLIMLAVVARRQKRLRSGFLMSVVLGTATAPFWIGTLLSILVALGTGTVILGVMALIRRLLPKATSDPRP